MENDPLAKARDLLLNSEIEAADYKILKSECERKISALEIKLFAPTNLTIIKILY